MTQCSLFGERPKPREKDSGERRWICFKTETSGEVLAVLYFVRINGAHCEYAVPATGGIFAGRYDEAWPPTLRSAREVAEQEGCPPDPSFVTVAPQTEGRPFARIRHEVGRSRGRDLPPARKIGKRLLWRESDVDAWIKRKFQDAMPDPDSSPATVPASPRRRGRPRKMVEDVS